MRYQGRYIIEEAFFIVLVHLTCIDNWLVHFWLVLDYEFGWCFYWPFVRSHCLSQMQQLK